MNCVKNDLMMALSLRRYHRRDESPPEKRKRTIAVSSPPRASGPEWCRPTWRAALVTRLFTTVGSVLSDWDPTVDYFDSLLAEGQQI